MSRSRTAVAFLVCVVFAVLMVWRITLRGGVARGVFHGASDGRTLAVVVPVYSGDVTRAMKSLEKWPTTCSSSTLKYTDLVIYWAESTDDVGRIPPVPHQASKCFRRCKIVSGNLLPEENVYPIGPSVQFYKMYLDPTVAGEVKEYDALAVIEWDVVVAHSTSFGKLYDAAFSSSEPFWVKGSTLAGTEFHETAGVTELWHILGHLNGNALYNNTDPGFTEFVNFTLARWNYTYSYDVALWATLSDFPYSWPLWQRYSSKFVATQLISNVGFVDVTETAVVKAASEGTLFIHGSATSGGSVDNSVSERHVLTQTMTDCTSVCGSVGASRLPEEMSAFCDPTCSPKWSAGGPRFGGHLCGAGDVTWFGSSCRLCYTDQSAALAADLALASPDAASSDAHVVMCSTRVPPADVECSAGCKETDDAVCDYRCGSGHYGDLHCNWRGLGQSCRFCFRDTLAAHIADEAAKRHGSRVIMCDTHEPPESDGTEVEAMKVGLNPLALQSPWGHTAGESEEGIKDPAETAYNEDVTYGEICAFLRGYFEFLPEMNASVSSVIDFMPGVRVGIATGHRDFHVFNRTVGQLPRVKVVNSSNVEYAALTADEACGNGTRYIYYMNIGQVLSRPFTPKDTHTARGELIVSFTTADAVDRESSRRAMASAALLGFAAPCFTYGSDLILPASINAMLRQVLRKKMLRVHTKAQQSGRRNKARNELGTYLAWVGKKHHEYASIYIPEVLAALAYLTNPDGLVFVDPKQWSRQNLFSVPSIWDIPLVKPRFGCTIDTSLSAMGYDVASWLSKNLDAFKYGAKCELGFKAVEPSELTIKADWEFGPSGIKREMPSLSDFRVTVMFHPASGEEGFLNASIASIIHHFPAAFEVVVVVVDPELTPFEEIAELHRAASPFPLRVVGEPARMDDTALQQKFVKMRGDLFTDGDFILHLETDAIIFQNITYAEMFHLGKPVLPFRRYRSETVEGLTETMCWQDGTALAIGEEVVHEFNIFDAHIYPRRMYAAARRFIEQHHGMSFVDFMATRKATCMDLRILATWTLEERSLLFSDFNFVGAFMWHHMHDAVYWLAADPFDTRPDEWRPNLINYAWVCNTNPLFAPRDRAGLERYHADFRMVSSVNQCHQVRHHWKDNQMLSPAGRTRLDTNSTKWTSAARVSHHVHKSR